MLVHPPDKLQNTLDYLNYSGVVFYRDNADTNHIQSNVSTVENIQSKRPKLAKKCLLCASSIINEEYKILGKNIYLCSTCKPLFVEITII